MALVQDPRPSQEHVEEVRQEVGEIEATKDALGFWRFPSGPPASMMEVEKVCL